jgi:hypothetical protein
MKELGVEMTIWEIHFYEKYDVLEKYGFYGNA